MSVEKSLLRGEIKKILRGLSPQFMSLHSNNICRMILESKSFAECDVLLSYMALWDEVDLSSVNERAFSGKILCLPRVMSADDGIMEFFCIRGDRPLCKQDEVNRGDRPLSSFLKTGSYNIKEPDLSMVKKLELVSLKGKKVLCLVPGVAFTKDGWRLGRGKGFYDRFLERLIEKSVEFNYSVRTTGICFNEQLVENLPVEANDIRLDEILTD